ncbi:MAG TPA: M23 family metallopeptidase [Rhizobiaceae bacterium]|nr:M23 family metallopeptidase [Rhizobiaceae bacterium]
MKHGIDSSFRLKKQALATRRRQARTRRALLGLGLLAVLLVSFAIYLTAGYWWLSDDDQELAASEGVEDAPAGAPSYVPAIVDLAGDPMWITLSPGGDNAAKIHSIARPAALVQPGISPQIEVLSDVMLSSSERFMTTIPSTQEDFAFFQAQRTVAPAPESTSPELPTAMPSQVSKATNDTTVLDPEAGWGETVDAGEAALPDFTKTQIENNTSVAIVTPEPQRFETTEDIFVKVLDKRSLDSVVLDAHFSETEGRAAGEAMKALFNRDALEAGDVVAMRGYRRSREMQAQSLMQVSIYTRDTFIGTLARNRTGVFVSGADPWVRNDLFHYSGAAEETSSQRQYRLLDAIYSTAARNNVPTAVIGEAIMYLSRGRDLNAFASTDERLILIYSETGRGEDGVAGRVLYVGVLGAEKKLECFVFQRGRDFACISGDDHVLSQTVANGMTMPVNGVLTSTFGPRKHPILDTVRIHKGVDWTAPAGTPVRAAFDGQIVFQGDGASYGNLVRIAHRDGSETLYGHMQSFAVASGVGTAVKAGQLIGYVGTTGLSTGPHLHFELYRNGQPVDPLGMTLTSDSNASAVELLTDRIIHVESAGHARARNPLSSATGLGQFIERTWIRMMYTYRADLVRTLSRDELLALRYDPTISREMVRNLAREGEAYLRARGHQVTAGRLYLCHFLGMEGAHQVLSKPAETMLSEFLEPAVFQANPFLAGRSAGYVVAWAERKMQGRSSWDGPSSPPPLEQEPQVPPEFEQYRSAVAEIVAAAEGTLVGGEETETR